MYNTELNAKIDETIVGTDIKKAFRKAYEKAESLKNKADGAIQPDGEFTSPVLGSFSEQDQIDMKAWIEAIKTACDNFQAEMDLINNPESESETAE